MALLGCVEIGRQYEYKISEKSVRKGEIGSSKVFGSYPLAVLQIQPNLDRCSVYNQSFFFTAHDGTIADALRPMLQTNIAMAFTMACGVLDGLGRFVSFLLRTCADGGALSSGMENKVDDGKELRLERLRKKKGTFRK